MSSVLERLLQTAAAFQMNLQGYESGPLERLRKMHACRARLTGAHLGSPHLNKHLPDFNSFTSKKCTEPAVADRGGV